MNLNHAVTVWLFMFVCWNVIDIENLKDLHDCNTSTVPRTTSVSTEAQGLEVKGRDVRVFNVSAYDACDKCCGKWNDGTYADGTPVGGLVVAAPRDIPFGTKISIPGYGVATVRDRGGAITEGCLDLYFNTHQEALNFGRHDIECEVLK